MNDRPEWFAPKRHGYGSGMPIAWQGWALSAGFVAIIGAAVFLLGEIPLALFSILVPASAILVVISARTTR
ncbi:MAG: hypothetical protein ACREBM_09255, partial [Sphingomicrobium sp.]